MDGFNTLEHQKMGQEKKGAGVAHGLSGITSRSDTPATVYRAVMANSPTTAR